MLDFEDVNFVGNCSEKLLVFEEVQDVIWMLICWLGDDFGREGLFDMLVWVVCVWKEYCGGYLEDFVVYFLWVFYEVGGYNEIVLLCDILFQFYCEYYMVLIIGKVLIVYLFKDYVVGIFKFVCVFYGFV